MQDRFENLEELHFDILENVSDIDDLERFKTEADSFIDDLDELIIQRKMEAEQEEKDESAFRHMHSVSMQNPNL